MSDKLYPGTVYHPSVGILQVQVGEPEMCSPDDVLDKSALIRIKCVDKTGGAEALFMSQTLFELSVTDGSRTIRVDAFFKDMRRNKDGTLYLTSVTPGHATVVRRRASNSDAKPSSS